MTIPVLRGKRIVSCLVFSNNREAVNLALRKLEAEQEVEAKKGELAAKLQEGIRKGGGQFSEPLVKEDYPPEEQEVLRALEVTVVPTDITS